MHSAGGALGAFFFILAVFLAGFWILVVSLKKTQPEPSAGAYYWPHRYYGGSSVDSSPKGHRKSSSNNNNSSTGSSSNYRGRPVRSRREEKRARAALPPIPASYREAQGRHSDNDYCQPVGESTREEFFQETLSRSHRNGLREPLDENEPLYYAPAAADVLPREHGHMQQSDGRQGLPPLLPETARSRNDGYDLSEYLEERRVGDNDDDDDQSGSRIEFVERHYAVPEPISHAVHADVTSGGGASQPRSSIPATASEGRVSKPAPWMTARTAAQPPFVTSRANSGRGDEEEEVRMSGFNDSGDAFPPPPPPLSGTAHSQPSPRWIRKSKSTAAGTPRTSSKSDQLSPASLASKGSSSSKSNKKSVQQQGQQQQQQGQPEQTLTSQSTGGPPARSAAAFRWG